MNRLFAALGLMLAALLWTAPAHASGDFECAPSWTLGQRDVTGCDDMGLLGPRNDTRTNLLLLLFDRNGREPKPQAEIAAPAAFTSWRAFGARYYPLIGTDDYLYSTGEGSRCRSNDEGAAAFAGALGAAKGVSAAERDALTAGRNGLKPTCGGMADVSAATTAAAQAKSPAAKEFGRYLLGAAAFYSGGYDDAAQAFASLGKAGDPWVRESARYMLGRVEVNRAQVDAYDEYGYPAHFDTIPKKVIGDAEANLLGYLRDYPKGRYAASAQGLLRRVYWLGGENAKLAAEYVRLLSTGGLGDGALADEIDDKLLRNVKLDELSDPMLIAVATLRSFRTSEAAVTRAQLEAKHRYFGKDEALYTYLLAASAYYGGAWRDVLQLVPDAARQPHYSAVEFSRQMLRGLALEALKDRNARGFWLELVQGSAAEYQRPAVELAIALHDERAGQVAKVFAPDSQVRDKDTRELLLMYAAGPALLRQQATSKAAPAHEREVALFTLLYKDVTRGAWRDFLGDVAMVPADAATDTSIYALREDEHTPTGIFRTAPDTGGYACPALRDSVARLAANPSDHKARLCVADFARVSGFDDHPLDADRPDGELGSAPSQFPGAPFSRLEIYKGVIADPRAPGPEKAYALYRAVWCYGPSGNNSCGGTEVDPAVRKGWFQRLKRDYPASPWAQDLKYYW